MRRASQRVILRIMPVLIANQNESITTFDELKVAQNFATATIFQKGTPVWSATDTGADLFVMPVGTETDLYLNGVLADDVRYEGAAMTEKKIKHIAVVTGGVVSVHTEIMGNKDRAYKDLDGQWKAYAIIGDRQLNEYRLVLKTGIREVQIGTKTPATRQLKETLAAFCASAISEINNSVVTLKPTDFVKKINDTMKKLHDKINGSPADVQGDHFTEAEGQVDTWHTTFSGNFPRYVGVFSEISANALKDRIHDTTNNGAVLAGSRDFKALINNLFELRNEGSSATTAQSSIGGLTGSNSGNLRVLAKAFYLEIQSAKHPSGFAGTFGGFADGDTSISFAQPPSSNPSVKKRRAIKEIIHNEKSARSAKGGSKAKALGPFIDPLAMGE